MGDYAFTPLQSSGSRRPADFPRVSADEQALRDADAQQIVAGEFDQDMPSENRAALESEYAQRFNAEPPASAGWKFTPVAEAKASDTGYKFSPLESDTGPSTMQRLAIAAEPYVMPALKTAAAMGNPVAVAETAGNLLTQIPAFAGYLAAGGATVIGRMLGDTDQDPKANGAAVSEAMTYKPMTEAGQHLTETVLLPLTKLNEAAEWAGHQVTDATGSPVAGALTEATTQMLPAFVAPAVKGARALQENFSRRTPNAEPDTAARSTDAGREQAGPDHPGQPQDAPGSAPGASSHEATRGVAPDTAVDSQYRFTPLEGADGSIQAREGGLVRDAQTMPQAREPGLGVLRGQGRDDLPSMDGEFQQLPGGHGAGTESEALAGAAGRAGELPAGELHLDDTAGARTAPDVLPEGEYLRPDGDSSGSSARGGSEQGYAAAALGERIAASNARQVTPEVGMADAQRRNPASSALGEADRSTSFATLGEDQQRHAAGTGVDAASLPQQKPVSLFGRDVRSYGTGELIGFQQRGTLRSDYSKGVVADELAHRTFETAGKELADARDQGYAIEPAAFDALAPETQAAVQFLHDNAGNPAAIREFSTRVKTAMDAPDAPPMRVMDEGAKASAVTERPFTSADTPPEAVQDMAAPVQNSWAPGANYVGMVDQIKAPVSNAKTVADLPAPLRREKIIGDLEKALGTTIYQGRVKGKKLGFFRKSSEEVRIKNANDIEVAAHEIGHLLDSRVPAISKVWRSDKAIREELKGISYDSGKISEGYAESIRLALTNPEALQAKAPKVFAWLDGFMQTHEYGPALRKAQEQMTAWFDQDGLNRARSKIGDPGKFGNSPVMQHLGDWWNRQKGQWRQSIADDLDGLYRAERSLTGKIAPAGAYETARLSRASASITDGAVRFGAPLRKPDGSYTFTGKGLHEILRPVSGRMDDFLLYAVGRSAEELMGQKREHLFTNSEIKAMVALETPEFRQALNQYQEWNRAVVSFAEQHGVINAESRAMWNRQIYLPFWRVSQPGEWKGAKAGDWKGVQALTGGTSNVKEILSNVIGNANLLITKALVNDARARVVKLIEENKGGRYLVEIPKESRPVRIGGDQVADAMLKRFGIAIDNPGYFDFMLTNQAPAGGKIIAVLENGKPRYFEVGDPLLFRSLVALERPPQHWLVKWLGLPKRLGQATITLDPTFIAGNLARDQVMSSVMSQSGFRPMIDAMTGLRSRITTDILYRDWTANGGGLSSMYLEEAALRKNLDRFYVKQGINAKMVLDAPGKMLYFIEQAGDAVESVTRIGEFKRALEKGDHPRHAAYKSKEVSVDWSAKGDSKALSVAFDTVMFLRAAVVSMDRVFRGVAHDPNRGAIAVKAGAIALASTALYLMNRGNPAYDDLEDWKKDAFWHVWIGGEHFMMPKAFEVGALASIGERTAERLLDGESAALGKDYIRIIGNVFGINWRPQIIAPLMDQAANRNSFTGAPIETPGMQDMQPFLRAKPTTSQTLKAAGMATRDVIPDSIKAPARKLGITDETFQVNPVRAEALLRGYLNSWGVYALMATDAMVSDGKAPAMRTDQMPVVRRFYAQEPPLRTKFETQFYDMLGEAKRLHGTMRELDNMGLKSYADVKEASPLATEAKPLEHAAKNLGIINKDSEQVRRDQALTPTEKRQKLDALTVERNALLKRAVTESKAAQTQKAMTPADVARQGITAK